MLLLLSFLRQRKIARFSFDDIRFSLESAKTFLFSEKKGFRTLKKEEDPPSLSDSLDDEFGRCWPLGSQAVC